MDAETYARTFRAFASAVQEIAFSDDRPASPAALFAALIGREDYIDSAVVGDVIVALACFQATKAGETPRSIFERHFAKAVPDAQWREEVPRS